MVILVSFSSCGTAGGAALLGLGEGVLHLVRVALQGGAQLALVQSDRLSAVAHGKINGDAHRPEGRLVLAGEGVAHLGIEGGQVTVTEVHDRWNILLVSSIL